MQSVIIFTHVVHHLSSVTSTKVIVIHMMNAVATFHVEKIIASHLFRQMQIAAILVSSLHWMQNLIGFCTRFNVLEGNFDVL